MLVTYQMFNADMVEFRRLMGLKTAWESGLIIKAYKALIYVYLRAMSTGKHPDTTEQDCNRMENSIFAAIKEFGMRYKYMINKIPIKFVDELAEVQILSKKEVKTCPKTLTELN